MSTTLTRPTFGNHLAARRLEVGLSLRGLGDKVGVSHAAISRWEHDNDLPRGEHMVRLAHALGVATSTVGRWLDDSPLVSLDVGDITRPLWAMSLFGLAEAS